MIDFVLGNSEDPDEMTNFICAPFCQSTRLEDSEGLNDMHAIGTCNITTWAPARDWKYSRQQLMQMFNILDL